jgi:hypothetical protein
MSTRVTQRIVLLHIYADKPCSLHGDNILDQQTEPDLLRPNIDNLPGAI